MSVASKNLFSLLQDDESEAVEATQQSSPQPGKADQVSPQSRSNQSRGRGPASRGGRYYQRGGKSSAATEEAPEEANENQARSDNRGRGRGGRGRGGGRGGSGPRRGREHDRQSGTLPVSEKRVAQGWGGEDGERELQNEEQGVADASAAAAGNDWGGTPAVAATNDWAGTGAASGGGADDWAGTGNTAAVDDWATPADGGAAATTDNAAGGEGGNANKDAGGEFRRRRQQEDEEDDNTLTLEQYLAQKKEDAASAVPKLEGVRKANEGSDTSLWKNAIQNNKNDDENYFVGKSKGPAKARTKKAEKEFIEIEAHFERPERGRGRGGRGGSRGGGGEERRGGGRGRGSRGGGARGGGNGYNRSPNTNSGQVDVADQSAFPSLT